MAAGIATSKPAMDAIHSAENSVASAANTVYHAANNPAVDQAIKSAWNTASGLIVNNFSVIPSKSVPQFTQQNTPSSRLHDNSRSAVQMNTSHPVAPTVSLLR